MIAGLVPALTHIAVCPGGPASAPTIDTRVLDRIAEAGIGLTLTADVRQTVFGANLVLATSDSPEPVRYAELTRGTVLVNSTGADLPDDVVDRVDKVYADAPDLMDVNRDRNFVRRHFNATRTGSRPAPDLSTHPPGVVVGIGDVLSGAYRCRVGAEEIRLVELLSVNEPDLRLATDLCRTARVLGLGSSYRSDMN
jgi:hypothetical protein